MWCRICQKEKSFLAFTVVSDNKRDTRCKTCEAVRHQERRKRQQNTFHNIDKLRYRYGMTLDEYKQMLIQQGNACAICGQATSSLDVDHDHSTGRVRGLLCPLCNKMLGNARDNILVLQNGIAYLKKGA